MKQSLPTSTEPNSTGFQFLQDSSLFTAPPQPAGGSNTPSILLPPPEQKILSPTKTDLAQLDSQGGIRIDLSVPASTLTLGRLLGKGGFGAVYEGLYQGKPVAIKQLSGHLSTDALAELKHEAEIMFQLGISSEHIVKLIKICLEMPYSLVMELMPQGSLYDLLRNGQDLPWQTRYQIAADAAQGLSDLHERKILHRDLKSLNILLRNGRAKLADFGLAKVKHKTGSQSSVTAKGTVLWMAPELFNDEPKVTTASDIYSFGMVLWELVTRQLPYEKAPNPMVAARWIEKGKKEEIPSDCPVELKAIIESCCNLIPAKRPTAIRVLTDLKPLAEQKVSPQRDSESEIKKLKAQMEQMKLAHERQMAEEKQQHQAELKHVPKDLKYKTPVQLPKSTLPLPSMSQTIPQTLMPGPKLKASREQLALQDRLIEACEQGDEKAVTKLLKQGAKPDVAGTSGWFSPSIQPLGAAVWGMCPHIVNALLEQTGGVAPMTWKECEQHNRKHYSEVFIIPKFNPQTYCEWDTLLRRMDRNLFVRTYHLKRVDEQWHNYDSASWWRLLECTRVRTTWDNMGWRPEVLFGSTEAGYVGYRSQIKQGIETAKQSTVEQISHEQQQAAAEEEKHQTLVQPSKSTPSLPLISQTIPQFIIAPPKLKATSEQLALQYQLIVACRQGDKKAVTALLKQGAKPDMPNTKGEQPLGAAVWGMCPDVVNALLKEAKGIAPMTWEECEKHNLKYYKEVFIIPKFDPQDFWEWNDLLQKMDPNPFIREFHLKQADEQWNDKDTSCWENLKGYVGKEVCAVERLSNRDVVLLENTEKGFISFRSQIKTGVETAKQPTVVLNF